MTRITATPTGTAHLGSEVRVNGRFVDFVNGIEIKRVGAATHEIEFRGRVFQVFGGRDAGGSRTDWFLEELDSETRQRLWVMDLSSAKAAVELIWNH